MISQKEQEEQNKQHESIIKTHMSIWENMSDSFVKSHLNHQYYVHREAAKRLLDQRLSKTSEMSDFDLKMRELENWIGSMEHIMVRPAVGWGHDRDELPKAVLTQAELFKGFALLFNVLEEINQSSAPSTIKGKNDEV